MKVAKKPDLNPHIRTWIRRQKNKINLGAEVLKQAPRAYYFGNSIRKAFMAYGNYWAPGAILKSRVEKAEGVRQNH